MDSAYLKSHVGSALAKGIAETVAAQPANPQEYLALYLLHYLQEEERRTHAVSQQKKASLLEREWTANRAACEKVAAETIHRGLKRFRARLSAKRAAEAALQESYDEATADAESILQQEDAIRQEGRDGQGAGQNANGDEDRVATEKERWQLQQQEERFLEARYEFYRTQRFLLHLQKADVGQLKRALLESKERVRVAKAALETIADNTAAEEIESAERDWRLDPTMDAQPLSEAAQVLAAQARGHKAHEHIAVPHVLYRVLRCLCYLLLDATPKATDSAAKVTALIKPTVLAATLRAFNPVATYDPARPLKLERNLPVSSSGEGDDGHDDDTDALRGAADGGGGLGLGEEGEPIPQPKTRQVRRVQRVLRSLLSDGEYFSAVKPSDVMDEEQLEDVTSAVAEEEEEHGNVTGAGGDGEVRQEHVGVAGALAATVKAAEADLARAEAVRASVEAQTKRRGGLVLWALLTFLSAAVAFRQSRDEVFNARRALGLETAGAGGDTSNSMAAMLEEGPDDEAEDEFNDESILDEEGMPDLNEVRRLQAKIGIDEDEQLVKLWEAKDERRRRELEGLAAAFRKTAAVDEDDGDDEDGDNVGEEE